MYYLQEILLLLLLTIANLTHAAQFRVTDHVYLDVERDGQSLGRIVIGLFGDLAPKTVNNFKVLATKGINGKTYKGTKFNRIIKRFMIQGGDVVHDNGKGSISIYGEHFEDENLDTKHSAAGFVSMANKGTDTNGCQFFITTIATPWLDNLHTVFGKYGTIHPLLASSTKIRQRHLRDAQMKEKKIRKPMHSNMKKYSLHYFRLTASKLPWTVVEGQNIVHVIEHTSTDVDDRPTQDVVIVKCGILPIKHPYYISDDPYDLWAWIKASAVPLTMSFSILGFFHWMIKKMEI